jgi:hypothetical protein
MTQDDEPQTLSTTTREHTALWPPTMHGLLRRAIQDPDPADIARHLALRSPS